MQKFKIKLNFNNESTITNFIQLVSNLPYDIDLSNGLTLIDAKSIVALFQVVSNKELELTLHTDDKSECDKFIEWRV